MSAISNPGNSTPGSPGSPGATGPLRGLANNAALKTTAVPSAGDAVSTATAVSAGDFGDGLFKWVSGTRPTEDGLFVIYHNTDTTGYFARKWDGRNVNLAWAGLAANASSASIQAILNLCAGKTVSVDKFYTGLTTSLTVPDGTTLIGDIPGVGFRGNGTLATLLSLGVGSQAVNLTLDGAVSSLVLFTGFTLSGAITLSAGSKVRDCSFLNVYRSAITGYNVAGARIRDCQINGAQYVAIFTQICTDLRVSGVQIKNVLSDGIKIHTRDGTITTTEGTGVYVENCKVDYTGVTISAATLAIELWGGQTTWQRHPHIKGNEIIGPLALTGSGGFWGISLDTVYGGVVEDCKVDGGVAGAAILYEAAGCQFVVFQNSLGRRHKGLGISVSQTRSSSCRFINMHIREAVGFSGVFGAQVVAGEKMLFQGCTFKDAGERYIYFNNAGNFSEVGKTFFHCSQGTAQAFAIYINGAVKGLNLHDIVVGPHVEPGETATAFNIRCFSADSCTDSTFKNWHTDNAKPDGSGSGPGAGFFGGGNNLVSGMRFFNTTETNSLIQFGGATASVFENNFCAVSARSSGTIDLLVGRNSA